MTRNYSSRLAAKVVKVSKSKFKGFEREIRVELDDTRATGVFRFRISPDIYWPFPETEDVTITIRRAEP